jgi:hypothetical protein
MLKLIIQTVSAFCQCIICWFLLLFSQSNPAVARDEEGQLAVKYCANYENSIKLSENGTILCFDGQIRQDQKIDELIKKLNERGFFVIRSQGGRAAAAIRIADLLLEKDATVVIHDYCLSACANYIFVATNRTYILKNSVVAWHGGVRCEGRSEIDLIVGANCKYLLLQTIFFQKREIRSGFIYNPPTTYTKMMFNNLTGASSKRSSISWMWNPTKYGDHFKGRVIYESYPKSQFEVDSIVERFKLEPIVYDPTL